MSLNNLDHIKLREDCRSRIESLELWLRRIINDELTVRYGQNYINHSDAGGHFLIKKDIRDNISNRYNQSPKDFPRMIDAAFFENLIDLFCNPIQYAGLFHKYMTTAFPHSMPHQYIYLKHNLDRLKEIRNNLSHANSISIKNAEFVLFFTTELIDSFKTYYYMAGKNQEYNVPQIIKIQDSFGNVIIRKNFDIHESYDFSGDSKCHLRPGDTLAIEIEIDPSYIDAKCQFRFGGTSQDYSYSNKLIYKLRNNDVDPRKVIHCQVRSDKSWHKQFNLDDQVSVYYKVLPPIES